ncbi:MAG: zf-HC2 domain-containing protein [Planctomycetota bacterium]
MNCTECKEKLVELLEGLLSESQRRIVEEHLKDCQHCQAELEELKELSEKLTSNSKAWQQTNLEDAVFNRIIRQQNEKLKQADRINRQFRLWRRIMNSKITKYSAAAVIIIAAVFSITLLDKSTSVAYAIEQTIEASHSVRYLHIQSSVSPDQEHGKVWVEFDEAGQVKNVRIDLPEWAGGGDGPKLVIWKDNKAQLWMKKKKSLVTIKDKTVAAQMVKMAEELDPKLAAERLQRKKEQGKIELEIEEPKDKAELIVITATSIEKDDSPFQRVVLFVDQATKLVISTELYKLQGGQYQKVMTLEYYDYNQPIDPKMFTMDDIPDDVMRVDQTTQEIGLAQGDLTGKEIAVKVIRQFYEALIAKDYAEAGRLFEGIPAEKIQEIFGNMNIVRIVSIGEAVPHPMPGVGGFQVHCKIEIEKNGVKSIYEPYGPGVRPVHGQPGRWGIHGGVE